MGIAYNVLMKSQYLESFKLFLEVEKGSSKNTVRAYISDIRQFDQFCKKRGVGEYKQITLGLLNEYKKFIRSLEPESIQRKLAALKTFLRYLNEKQKFSFDFIEKILLPKKQKKLPTVINEEEAFLIIKESILLRDKAILELLYCCGLRVS